MDFLEFNPKCNLPSYSCCTSLGNVVQSSSNLGENALLAPLSYVFIGRYMIFNIFNYFIYIYIFHILYNKYFIGIAEV